MVLFIESSRLSLLPPVARQMVREMQDNYNDNYDLCQNAAKRLNETEKKIGLLEARLFANDGRMSGEQAEELNVLREDADASRARLTALRDEGSRYTQVLALVDRWLSQPGRTVSHLHEPSVEIFDVPLPKPKGDLAEIRRRIMDLNIEQQQLMRAAMSREECEAAISVYVDRLAKAPVIRGLDGRGRINIETLGANPMSLLAWLDPDKLKARLLQSVPATESSLTKAEKAKRLAEIEEEKLQLERVEEALVRATPGTERRPDADVRAILSIDERPRSQAKAA